MPYEYESGFMIEWAAMSYVIIVFGVIVFQFCLIVGLPWGRLTQGGAHEGVLPQSGREIAGVSVFLLLFMGASIVSAAGLSPNWPIWSAYIALGIQFLSTFLNWITPSVAERRLWAPITSVMLVLATYVVFG